jgi:acid phosphatase
MGKKYEIFFSAVFIFAAVLINGCSSQQTYLVNLEYVKEAVIDYHESGKFTGDTEKAISDAIGKFDKIIPKKNSAVIFDIDETALSNYQFIKDWDFGYVKKYFDMWIDSAKAPAIPGVLKLYDYLSEKNFRIIFITGRYHYQYDATYKNLVDAGYTKFDTVIVKGEEYHGVSALEFKSDKRKELAERGYIIEGCVGDQWSDLDGPYHGIQVKIPNYQYIVR